MSSDCSGRGEDVDYIVLVIINTLMTMIMRENKRRIETKYIMFLVR